MHPVQGSVPAATPASSRYQFDSIAVYLPGIALSVAIALAAVSISEWQWLRARGVSALIVAMVLGMAAGNAIPDRFAVNFASGTGFCRQRLLRAGIVLFGIHMTLQDIGRLGVSVILMDVLVLLSTMTLAIFIGKRVLKLDTDTVLLVGAGSSICGAAAVIATEPVLRARPAQVTVAVSTVVVFGTLATFLYPVLFQLNQHWQVLPAAAGDFGIYAGATIHEVAQVVAATRALGDEAANNAVIAKMLRVMLLSPFLLALSAYVVFRQRRLSVAAGSTDVSVARITIPWFAFGFVGMVALNSVLTLAPAWRSGIAHADALMLTTAMAALGLNTHFSALRQAGRKPILLAAGLFVWLTAGGAVLCRLFLD